MADIADMVSKHINQNLVHKLYLIVFWYNVHTICHALKYQIQVVALRFYLLFQLHFFGYVSAHSDCPYRHAIFVPQQCRRDADVYRFIRLI